MPDEEPQTFTTNMVITATAHATHPDGETVPEVEEQE